MLFTYVTLWAVYTMINVQGGGNIAKKSESKLFWGEGKEIVLIRIFFIRFISLEWAIIYVFLCIAPGKNIQNKSSEFSDPPGPTAYNSQSYSLFCTHVRTCSCTYVRTPPSKLMTTYDRLAWWVKRWHLLVLLSAGEQPIW